MFSHSVLNKTRKSRSQYKQGFYNILNENKYVGDKRSVVFRSSWEQKFLIFCDITPAILQFSSEETIIPYKSPVDKRWHRYFVDFKIKMNTRQGVITALIEIKPDKYTRMPVKPKKMGKRYVQDCITFAVNEAKWEAARAYCKKQGFEFIIVTEKNNIFPIKFV